MRRPPRSVHNGVHRTEKRCASPAFPSRREMETFPVCSEVNAGKEA